MRNMKSANKAAFIIGMFGIFAGVLSVIAGQEFYTYFLTLIISISLAGAALID